MITMREATLDDAFRVDARMRAGDVDECLMFGVTGAQAIEAGLKASVITGCLLVDGEPAAVYGLHVPNLMASIGQPWILTSEAIETHRIGYARAARALVQRAFRVVARLENVVDIRYQRAVNLLEWLGFTLEPEQAGLRRFWMEKN